jgi:hypothetical protein
MAQRDYLSEFPVPSEVLPKRLREMLVPVGLEPNEQVEVCAQWSRDPAHPTCETVHMLMAVVHEDASNNLAVFDEAGTGLVEYSVPILENKGNTRNYLPSVSGHDYIVAAWGDGSFYSFSLAEKVWMSLGLSPRCIGNDEQRLVYDDLGEPVFGVAEGEVSMRYHFGPSRNVIWKMSNEYLRKYLWMRGAVGVRTFFYEATVPDVAAFRQLMNGQPHIELGTPSDWFIVDIREFQGSLLLQVWATVAAVTCELCPLQSCETLTWPGIDGVVTRSRANAMIGGGEVFLDDKFLERYEQSAFYDSVPCKGHGQWLCSPSYLGQWSFTGCRRVGRNAIHVTIRDLYKSTPDREIIHAHQFVLNAEQAGRIDRTEEHIASKTDRLVAELLDLGDNLSRIGQLAGLTRTPIELVGFSREEIAAEGWRNYPQLCRLAQVAPLDMTQQSFLARCKSLHEVWQRVPDGFLRRLLEAAGCHKNKVKDLRSLKLLQALLNISERLDGQDERAESILNTSEPDQWEERNPKLAVLFLNNDLRIADAHESVDRCIQTLQDMGFDTASLNQGYGRAIDFVFDGVIASLRAVNEPIRRMLGR